MGRPDECLRDALCMDIHGSYYNGFLITITNVLTIAAPTILAVIHPTTITTIKSISITLPTAITNFYKSPTITSIYSFTVKYILISNNYITYYI